MRSDLNVTGLSVRRRDS